MIIALTTAKQRINEIKPVYAEFPATAAGGATVSTRQRIMQIKGIIKDGQPHLKVKTVNSGKWYSAPLYAVTFDDGSR